MHYMTMHYDLSHDVARNAHVIIFSQLMKNIFKISAPWFQRDIQIKLFNLNIIY